MQSGVALVVALATLLSQVSAIDIGHSNSGEWNLFPESGGQSSSREQSAEREEAPGPLTMTWHYRLGWGKPWWEGKNVCDRENIEEKNATTGESDVEGGEVTRHFSSRFQTCEESESVYKCTITEQSMDGYQRKTVLLYECCNGFSRERGDHGCPKRVQLNDIITLAEELGLKDFLKSARVAGLERDLKTREVTVFAPIDGGFGGAEVELDGPEIIFQRDAPYSMIIETDSALDRAKQKAQTAILSHVISGARRSSSFGDESVVEAGGSDATGIRINFFYTPQKMMTANCVPVVSRDNLATNGVIHTVQRYLPQVTHSLMDMVQSRPDLSTLKTVLATARYVPKLDKDGQGTLLAPSNDAFARMNARLRRRLLAGDVECLQKVLDNHLLPYTICSAVINGKSRTPNQLGKYMNLTRTDDGKYFIHGAQITQKDLVATNGVMHVIDKVIVPDEALDVLDLLEREGFTDFLQLVEDASLTKVMALAENVTLFAPTNNAIQNLPSSLRSELTRDPELLRNVIKYHVSPGATHKPHLHDKDLMPSLHEDASIRIDAYSLNPFHHYGLITAQCVPIAEKKIKACNGNILPVTEVMVPPRGTVLDTLALDNKFNMLVSLIKRAGLGDMLQEDGPFTVFAPSNKAIERLGRTRLSELRGDSEKAKHFVEQHLHKGSLCCAGIFRSHSWFSHSRAKTVSGHRHRLSRDFRNMPKVGGAHIVTCDLTATNGNVMELDTVLSTARGHRSRHARRGRAHWEHFRLRHDPFGFWEP